MANDFNSTNPYIKSNGPVTSSSPLGGIGYVTGAGGAVTQGTSKSTTVILNTVCGVITSHNASLAGAAIVTFTLTNSSIAATDIVVPSIQSGDATGLYTVATTHTAAGSCKLTLTNIGATAGEVVLINFSVIKGVNS